ncbi:MAG: TolC family outer membrane protein [Oceanobacter sp.]
MKKLISIPAMVMALNSANANDISTIYQQAASNDAEIAAARATREANQYDLMIARGDLLPQLAASYSYTQYSGKAEGSNLMAVAAGQATDLQTSDVDVDYSLGSLQISASQALLNLNAWYTYQAAKTGDEAYQVQLQLAEQQLLLRVAEAYFNVLRAEENLATAEAAEKAVKRSLEQTRQRYDVGLIAITEVHEAQASYDLSYVNLIDTQSAVDISYEALEQLTGQRYDRLSSLDEGIILQMPEPQDASAWVETGLGKYTGVRLAEIQREAVRQQRNATRSNHLPTVTLNAAYVNGENAPTFTPDPTESSVTTVGIQVSMPLLAGGSLYGQSKKAAKNYAAADFQLEQQKRTVKTSIRTQYRQLETIVKNIAARKQAITSAESALEATKAGYDVGTRNIVEVLNAQNSLFSAQSNYANARYDYVLSLLNLKFYAGTLNEADLNALNDWLI